MRLLRSSCNPGSLAHPPPSLSRTCVQENERLRSEVGELKTARFSAEAMATRLEEMNALSIRVRWWAGCWKEGG